MRYAPTAALAALALIAAAASAQCDPIWNNAPGVPGFGTGYADPAVGWNDGSGTALYVGGSFDEVEGQRIRGIAKYDFQTDMWSRLGSGISYGNTNGFLTAITPFQTGGESLLVVGGFFSSAGGVSDTQSLAAWDGTGWRSLGAGFIPPQSVWGLEVLDLGDGEKLYIGGGFDAIGGEPASGVAAWNGTDLEVIGEGIAMTGFSPFVNELTAFDDGSGLALYAAGRFSSIDGVNAALAARYRPGVGWERFGGGLVGQSSTTTLDAAIVWDDGAGAALYLAGSPFRPANGGSFGSVYKWNGTTWTQVGQNIGGRVTDLIVWDDGTGEALYLSGTATPDVNYLARLEGGQWVPYLGGVLGPSISGNFPSVFGLGTYEGDLVVCGNFTRTGDEQSASGIALIETCASDCVADFNGDGAVDTRDVTAFLNAWVAGDGSADIDDNGVIDTRDVLTFLNLWAAGC